MTGKDYTSIIIDNGFTFYKSYYNTLKACQTDEERAAFAMAVCAFMFDGKDLTDEIPASVRLAFIATIPTLITSKKRGKSGSIKTNQTKSNEIKTYQIKSNQIKTPKGQGQDKVQVKDKNIYAPCPRCGKPAARRKNTTCSYVCHECGWDGVIDD